MLWKGMAGRSWTGLVQEWGVPQVEALQLQKSIAALMREMGPRLGDLHLNESTGPLALRFSKIWVTSPSVKVTFMDSHSLSQSPK